MLDADALVKILSKNKQDPRCTHLRTHADAAGLIDFPTLLAVVSELDEEQEGARDGESGELGGAERKSTRRQRIYDEGDEEGGRPSIVAWRRSQDSNSQAPPSPEQEGLLKVTISDQEVEVRGEEEQ